MSFNLTIHTDLSCINDDDLNLDLGDDDELKKPQLEIQKIDSNNNKNNEEESLFKVPDAVPSSSGMRYNLNNLEEAKLAGLDGNLETTLDNLFENADEDEEDFLIRTQTFFSSTQSSSDCPRVNFSPPDPDIFIQKPEAVKDLIISTQSAGELMRKSSRIDETITVDSTISDFNDLTVWKHAHSDLNVRISRIGLDPEVLKKYTLDYYYKKFFDYSLLRIAETGLKKLPLLTVWIKEISRNDRNSNATVTLTDGVETIKGTISKQITFNYWEMLHIGSVLLLQNVCLLRVNNYAKNGYHLNINKPNIIMIYHKKAENKINRCEFNELRRDNIKDFIDYFDKTYVFIDTNLIKVNTSVNKTNLNISNNNNANTNNSVNKSVGNRPAPYTVPAQYNKNKQNTNNTTTSTTSNKNNNIKTNQNRTFNFNRNNSNPSLNCLNKNTLEQSRFPKSISDLNKNKNHIVNSSQKEINEDVLSQLIFGIEDEFLKEDE